eukprot:5695406-Amphidinium_carterae.1
MARVVINIVCVPGGQCVAMAVALGCTAMVCAGTAIDAPLLALVALRWQCSCSGFTAVAVAIDAAAMQLSCLCWQ